MYCYLVALYGPLSEVEVGFNETSYSVLESIGSMDICIVLSNGLLGTDLVLQLDVHEGSAKGNVEVPDCICVRTSHLMNICNCCLPHTFTCIYDVYIHVPCK